MKFYIASRLENAEEVSTLAEVLKAAGHTHTYDWTAHGSAKDEVMEQVARNELRGVMAADIVIILLPGGRGTHAELGIALGSSCESIIICAKDDGASQQDGWPCPFYWNTGVKRVVGDMAAWLVEILQTARAVDCMAAAECCEGR